MEELLRSIAIDSDIVVYINKHGIIERMMDMSIPITFSSNELDEVTLTKYQGVVFNRLSK